MIGTFSAVIRLRPDTLCFSALFVGRVIGTLCFELSICRLQPFQCPLCWARDWNVPNDLTEHGNLSFSALFVGRVIGTVADPLALARPLSRFSALFVGRVIGTQTTRTQCSSGSAVSVPSLLGA